MFSKHCPSSETLGRNPTGETPQTSLSVFRKIRDWTLDLLFPRFCAGCKKEGFFICPKCLEKIPRQKSVSCFFCQKRLSGGLICLKCKEKYHLKIDGIFVAADWSSHLLRELIYLYKYSFIKELATPLSKLMIDFWQTNQLTNWLTDQLILVPIPLFKRRLIWRGFNQAEILAETFGNKFGIELKEILERPRATFPQMEIKDKKTRQENVSGAFKIKTEFLNLNLKNKTVILIDDVSTTGATLLECAKVLKTLKPKRVFGLVVARG